MNNCKICNRAVFSDSVSIVGTTLVIDIPARSGGYANCEKLCLFVIQSIPTAATIAMPVAISIGGDTTTLYPLTKCDCSQVTACGIRTRHRYVVKVATTSTSGVFKVLNGLCCAPQNNLSSIPAPTTTTPTASGGNT